MWSVTPSDLPANCGECEMAMQTKYQAIDDPQDMTSLAYLPERSLEVPFSSVNFSSRANFNYDDDELAVLNLVDYPVISVADSVIFFARQFHTSSRMVVVFE
jgi:hypothetical protein